MYNLSAAVKTNPIKPNFKPNFRKAKMDVNLYVIKDYENETAFGLRENKPNQTQPVVSLPALPVLSLSLFYILYL